MTLAERIDKTIEIPSDIEYIKKVSHEILGHLKKMNIGEAVQFNVRLAVEEAVRNAIEHGHCYNKKLPITVSYTVDKEKIEVTVKDIGKGFDVKSVPDPRTKDNIMKESGRGIFLIHKVMDKVVYNKEGNKVTMTKFLKSRV